MIISISLLHAYIRRLLYNVKSSFALTYAVKKLQALLIKLENHTHFPEKFLSASTDK